MKPEIILQQVINNRPKLLLLTVFLALVMQMPLSGNAQSEKIKSRFPFLKFNISAAEGLRSLRGYDHFIFQLSGSDKSGFFGKRRIYTLIVFAADKDGKIIDPNPVTPETEPTKLDEIEEKIEKDINDRNTEVTLSNYIMKDAQYRALTAYAGTSYLRFDPSIKNADNVKIFIGYITYEVYPVSIAGIKLLDIENFADDNYLKPSPPAPPPPGP